MLYDYELKNLDKDIIDDYFNIFDKEEPIIDSNFDNFDEREISCLTRVNFQTV